MRNRLFYSLLLVCWNTGILYGQSYTKSVDPFIGTAATGHTYPAATLPFAMVQVGPDTGTKGWANCSGYHSDDNSIMGFSHTHLSGTGASEMGDILIMPITGMPQLEAGSKDNPTSGYRSVFRHETEVARPGYYAVKLDNYDIYAEMTASYRSAIHRYTFPAKKQTGVLLDMGHGIDDKTRESAIRIIDDRTVVGYRRSGGFIRDHIFYFCARFSQPFTHVNSYTKGEMIAEKGLADKIIKVYLQFNASKENKEKESDNQSQLLVKVGLSTVSEEGAMRNLDAEIPAWNFEQTATQADKVWNDYLSKIEIDAVDAEHRTIFYTALYHSLIAPNLVTDTDGSYRGWDRKVHKSTQGDYYTNFSLWDTYRAVHPLYTLLYPDKNKAFINSMMQRYREIGQLPINEYGSNETYCMIGYHAIPVIAEAILRDKKGFDYNEAFEAMKKSANDDARGVGLMKKYGYIPSELENNSVSKVVEYAYDDWCIAQVAKRLKRTDDYNYFIQRAKNYKNHFDTVVGFMRGRNANGNWVTPFDPRAVSVLGQGDFTEGNSWHYSFYVPQDMTTFVKMMGGDEPFAEKLDEMFNAEEGVDNAHAVDVTGLIGQYAHGNEPSHHTAYLYNFAGKPWRTQQMVDQIRSTLYLASREGLCGNDDCGQMSSWYVFSALGFYPVTPGMDYYVIGTPSLKKATLHLPNGKDFVMTAKDASPQNIYIQALAVNGKSYPKSYLLYKDIVKGGTASFTMSDSPNKAWATSTKNRPVSIIID